MKFYLITLFLSCIMVSCGERSPEKIVRDGMAEVNGTRLYYKTIGRGEPILVIHGGPGLGHQYLLPHLKMLAADYQLIFYDQRATGRSSLEVDTSSMSLDNFIKDIDALRLFFERDSITIMAHSWGGLLALQYALQYPDKVESLILISSSGASSTIDSMANQILARRFTEDDNLERNRIMRSKEFWERQTEAMEEMMMTGFKHQFYDTAFLAELNLELNENFAASSQLLQYMSDDFSEYNWHSELSAIENPTLLIYCDQDPLTTLAGLNLKESMYKAELKIIQDCGHFPFIEQPELFKEEVKHFLSGLNN